MAALVIWMFAFTISICVAMFAVALDQHIAHMSITALVTLTIAIVGVQTHRRLAAAGANRSALAANTARFSGLIWIWAGVAMLVIYSFILVWRESLVFFLGLMIVGTLCLALARMFERDGDAGREDETMLGIARTLNALQVGGMLIAMVGLIADGKFGLVDALVRPDWAANNIFFFGAFGVAALGIHAIASERINSRQAQL
jgi:hypothetical protein